MKTVCPTDQCAGCMACVDICPKGAISIQDTLTAYNAVIDTQLCVECDACIKVCQHNTIPHLRTPLLWKQGWAADPQLRAAGSSGGIAGALAHSFVRSGGAVCSCVFRDGEFCFQIAHTPEQVNEFAGSKYIKSNPRGSYRQVKQLLKENVPVLFIGLPCQCAAVIGYVGPTLQEKLYTADLICHGSPSPQVLDAFLQQHATTRQALQAPSFRKKGVFRFADGDRCYAPGQTRDQYTLSFLNMLTYTENCYTCPYARTERVSDISLGDSWGSELAADEVEKGISLVVCQTEKGKELLANTPVVLFDVDSEKAIACNHQLRHPSQRPAGRQAFFQKLAAGGSFRYLVFQNFPKQCFRQSVKGMLHSLFFSRNK